MEGMAGRVRLLQFSAAQAEQLVFFTCSRWIQFRFAYYWLWPNLQHLVVIAF